MYKVIREIRDYNSGFVPFFFCSSRKKYLSRIRPSFTTPPNLLQIEKPQKPGQKACYYTVTGPVGRKSTKVDMTKLFNDEYKTIRGFNYQPSYASHGLQVWGDAFDIDVIKKELELGKKHYPGINTLRLWLSFDAFLQYPQCLAERFGSIVDLGETLGLRFIPTLFNGWHSLPDFGGISVEAVRYWGVEGRFDEAFLPFIESIVKPFATDHRILLWDLCNEPFNSALCDASRQAVLGWLKNVYWACKRLGALAPITVGSIPDLNSIRLLEPISDVITFHPYYARNLFRRTVREYEDNVDETVDFANSLNKPLLATETGWGAMADKERADILAVELGVLSKYGIGFTAHLLCHTLVADGHRPEYGPITAAGYMAFVELDGSMRPYHGIFNEY